MSIDQFFEKYETFYENCLKSFSTSIHINSVYLDII